MNLAHEIKKVFKESDMLARLILINVGICILIWIIYLFALIFSGGKLEGTGIIDFFTVPAYLPSLITRPWTIVTYMFTHLGFLHIVFNMLWLFWFGKIFLKYMNSMQLLSVYIYGGLMGAILFISIFNLLPAFRPTALNPQNMLGASASVTAVIFAIAFYSPRYKINLMFIGPVQIIWVALVAFFVTTIMDIQENTGGKIAHIGGALYGYLFAVQMKKGNDITRGLSVLLTKIFDWFKPKKNMRVTHNQNKRPTNRPETDMEYNARKVIDQAEIDKILDKIKKSGYDSLSKKEKEILFKASDQK